MIRGHTITRGIARGQAGKSFYRAQCSCGDFRVDVDRLNQAARRRQARQIIDHLGDAGLPLIRAADIEAGHTP